MCGLANLSKACSVDDGLDILSLTEVDVMLIDGAARKAHSFFIVIVELQPGEGGREGRGGRGREEGRDRRGKYGGRRGRGS